MAETEKNAMIERVAQAIAARLGMNYEHQLTRDRCLDAAQDALAAMIDPTEEMEVAGHNVRSDPNTGLPTLCGVDEIYNAMVKAALFSGIGYDSQGMPFRLFKTEMRL